MKRVIVTGATGFIGRHALPELVSRQYEVHAVGLNTLPELKGQVTFHKVDLLEEEKIIPLMKRLSPTHLLHFAWYAKPGKYWNALENFSWVKASISLMEAFQRCGGRRAVFAGSCAEYDWSQDVSRVTEMAPCSSSAVYAVCKHALYQILLSYAKQTGISFAWGRVFHLFGPHEYTARLVPYVIRSLLEQSNVDCSAGHQLRDFMDVRDVAAAFVALLDSPVEGAVNIASGKPIELRQLVNRIKEKIGGRGQVNFGARPTPANEPAALVAETTRLESEVGWQPERSMDEALDDTICWWKAVMAAKGQHG